MENDFDFEISMNQFALALHADLRSRLADRYSFYSAKWELDGPVNWPTYMCQLCIKGDIDGLQELLKTTNRYVDDYDLETVLSSIGVCHLIDKPEMADCLIQHYRLGKKELKIWAWLILSKTYHNLTTVRSIMTTYEFTIDDLHNYRELELYMFEDMCNDEFIMTFYESMNAFIWAFTELGLPRKMGLLALEVAAKNGRTDAASWLIDHFKITPAEVFYTIDPSPATVAYNAGYIGTYDMLCEKYTYLELLAAPIAAAIALAIEKIHDYIG